MAYAGQILDNPVSGERIIFRRTAADTDGELLEIDLELAPDGHVPGKHVHPVQEERFEVISGTMKFKMGRRTVIAEAGETVTVPPGTPHKFENGGDETAHVRVQVRPALRMEELFETAVSLAKRGPHHVEGHAQAARPGPVRARVRRRGPGRLPARLGPAGHDGAAGVGRLQARLCEALHARPGLRSHRTVIPNAERSLSPSRWAPTTRAPSGSR